MRLYFDDDDILVARVAVGLMWYRVCEGCFVPVGRKEWVATADEKLETSYNQEIASHTRMDSSADPDTIFLPSGLNDTDFT